MDILKVKVNGSWVPIPAITGPEGPTGDPGVGIPAGGTDGQMLVKDGATDYSAKWVNQPTVPVQDVQIDGTSILDPQGVAEIPMAGSSTPGVVKINSGYGIYLYNGELRTSLPSLAQIQAGNNNTLPLTVNNQHNSTFYGLAKAAGDTSQSSSSNAVGSYTEDAKSKISEMLNGSVTVSGTTPTITAKAGIQYVCGEVTTLDITVPESGCFDVTFESGSIATALTITVPTGYTLEWSNDFDPSSLDADTTYEINIKTVGTKCLGVAASWT